MLKMNASKKIAPVLPRRFGRSLVLCLTASALLLACASCGQKLSDRVFLKGEKEKVSESEMDVVVPVVYVALGDSTGVGVGAQKGGGYVARLFERIEGVRAGSRLFNLCVSGATTADVLRAQVERVGEARPTLITLGIGINDVSRQVKEEQFARNYEEIVTRLREKTDAPVVLTNIPDVSYAPAVPAFMRDEVRRRIQTFNARIADVAARHNLLLVDAYTQSHTIIPEHPEFFSSDKFHPSDEGYEFWAVQMWPTVKQAIGEEE